MFVVADTNTSHYNEQQFYFKITYPNIPPDNTLNGHLYGDIWTAKKER